MRKKKESKKEKINLVKNSLKSLNCIKFEIILNLL